VHLGVWGFWNLGFKSLILELLGVNSRLKEGTRHRRGEPPRRFLKVSAGYSKIRKVGNGREVLTGVHAGVETRVEREEHDFDVFDKSQFHRVIPWTTS
jgi:hypothetical protein